MNDIEKIINNIPKIKFYNLSFRCYRGVYKKYVVGIFPFVTDIFEIINKPGKIAINGNFDYSEYDKNVIEIFRIHLQDHRKNPEKYFDPCLLYEEIIGDKIHTNPSNGDQYKMNLPKQ